LHRFWSWQRLLKTFGNTYLLEPSVYGVFGGSSLGNTPHFGLAQRQPSVSQDSRTSWSMAVLKRASVIAIRAWPSGVAAGLWGDPYPVIVNATLVRILGHGGTQ